jgi:4-alpha-glucanotransferase
LRLGTTARMNLPGKAEGNWRWRFDWNSISDAHILGLRKLNDLYGRTPSTNVRDISRGEESSK